MDRVKSLIQLARGRMRLAATLEACAVGAIAAAAVLALLVVLAKLLAAKLMPGVVLTTPIVLGSAAAAGVLAGVIFALRRASAAPTDAQVALQIDERLRLDERLTSALAFETSTDPYARAAIADAVAVASDQSVRPKVRAAFPARFPNRGLFGALAVAALACVQWFVPAYQWPVEEEKPADAAKVAQKKESTEALERVKQELESSKALPKELRDSLAQVARNADAQVGGEPVDEDARREAIRRMSELSNRLDELKKSDAARKAEALKRDLSGLEKQDGPMSKFAEDLAKGDFAAAKQELADLAKKLDSGTMSEADKAAAAAALEKMSKSLDAIADRKEALRDELAKAGLDPQLANNPEALDAAVKNSPNLTEQQREQLQAAAKASKASQDALRKMANATKQAASQQKGQSGEKKQQQQQGGQKGQQGGQKQQQQQQTQQSGSQQGQQGGEKQQQQQSQQGGQQGPQSQQGQQPSGQQGDQGQQGSQKMGQQPGGSQQQGGEKQSGEQGAPGAQGEKGEDGESGAGGLSELSQSLSEFEVTQQMLEEAEALSNMAQGESESLGQGMCKGGSSNNSGAGQQPGVGQGGQRGGAGRGQGGNTGKSKTPTGTKTIKAATKNAGGDIIARQLIENPNPEVAESVMPQESIDSAAAGGAGMSVGEDAVPSHLQDAHKHYFGTLKKEIAKKGGAPAGDGGAKDTGGGGAAKPAQPASPK